MSDAREVWEQDMRNVFSAKQADGLFELSQKKNFRVSVTQNDELSKGQFIWVIGIDTPEEYQGEDLREYWLASFGTRKEAEEFCREMGWKIKSKK